MSKELEENTLDIIDKMFFNQEKINFYTVCEAADVSRGFLYNHPDIVTKINLYREFNSLTIDERITKLQLENRQLKESIQKYEALMFKGIVEE